MTDIYEIRTKAPGPSGMLPVTEDLLLRRPSGDLFGMPACLYGGCGGCRKSAVESFLTSQEAIGVRR